MAPSPTKPTSTATSPLRRSPRNLSKKRKLELNLNINGNNLASIDSKSHKTPTKHEQLQTKKEALLRKLEKHKSTEIHAKMNDPIESRSFMTHSHYLLQEMSWMAADFQQERKWKRNKAKKLSRGVLMHHKNAEMKIIREKKSEESNRRRIASRLARDIKKFWSKIDKIIEYKQKLEDDETKKKIMDKHLRFLVRQTEKYSSSLASSLAASSIAIAGEPQDQIECESSNFKVCNRSRASLEMQGQDDLSSDNSVRKNPMVSINDSSCPDMEEDEDYVVLSGAEEEKDDEATIEEAEMEADEDETIQELEMLEREKNMSIEELKKYYATKESQINRDKLNEKDDPNDSYDSVGDESSDEMYSFVQDETEVDDESTIAIAEEEDENEGAADEISGLEEESNLPIEELMKRYSVFSTDEVDSKAETENDQSDSSGDDVEVIFSDTEVEDPERTISIQEELQSLEEDEKSSPGELKTIHYSLHKEDEKPIEKQKIMLCPYLLSKRLILREYQEVGVNWLVKMAEKRMNGILADEMGLGKTIQTISLLAHFAASKGIWGPHLIIVPTSCLVNWEMELKRWCPAFKVLSYYGSSKRRKEMRQGWSRYNAFHICITSYQLIVQDAHCFRRRKWYFMILDEAHNIKNWKSQRWQTLLHFNTQRRLLLTGTPLQNNLMELWSLMHFLMPHIFSSRKEFGYWFNQPMTQMVEGEKQVSESLVSRLHGVIRPFVLRRLKKDVEKQLPGKYEHVITCTLSKRQRFLYEDFISRSSTRKAMSGGSFFSMMNVLMQLRKVCNHPDLFEPRPIVSSFDMQKLTIEAPWRLCSFSEWIEPKANAIKSLFPWTFADMEVDETDTFSSARWKELLSFSLPSRLFKTVSKQEYASEDVARSISLLHASHQKQFFDNQKRYEYMMRARMILSPIYGRNSRNLFSLPLSPTQKTQASHYNAKTRLESPDCLLNMIKTTYERINDMKELITRVTCVVPKVRAFSPSFQLSKWKPTIMQRAIIQYKQELLLKSSVEPFHFISRRQQLFFPDKRLIEFDCGKMQKLQVLLRELKRTGHRCLIFTQMSSMLNILETFLNIHGHTYFRLDGSTKVEQRQRLMDRFNSNEKIFAFILSTRSGGLGINLTGADTVIFYDSDWNPAMDAQAQDRAHRIGQTRDVHIYRFISEHTVEENILRKAQQKRHLDMLVMSEGKFTTDFFSKNSLRELVGEVEMEESDVNVKSEKELSVGAIEETMAQLEDAEDVVAMRVAKDEAKQDALEFSEESRDVIHENQIEENNVNKRKRNEVPNTGRRKKPKKHLEEIDRKELEMEAEQERQLQAWKESVSLSHFEQDLRPIDRYALHYRQEMEKYLPLREEFEIPEEKEIEMEEIEQQKVIEEQIQFKEGELIGAFDTNDIPCTSDELKNAETIYRLERKRFHREEKRKAFSGEHWIVRTCVNTKHPFYFNTETRESQWEKPIILQMKEEWEERRRDGYGRLPISWVVRILGYLSAYPDRIHCSTVCRRWSAATRHASFSYYLDSDSSTPLDELVLNVEKGSTIVLRGGIHRIKKMIVHWPMRIIGKRHTVVELHVYGGIVWKAPFGLIKGIVIRRQMDSKLSPSAASNSLSSPALVSLSGQLFSSFLVSIEKGGKLHIRSCNLDGGKTGLACLHVGNLGTCLLQDNRIFRSHKSGVLNTGGNLIAHYNMIFSNGTCGICLFDGNSFICRNIIQYNSQVGIRAFSFPTIQAFISKNQIVNNVYGAFDIEEDLYLALKKWKKWKHLVNMNLNAHDSKVNKKKTIKGKQRSRTNATKDNERNLEGSRLSSFQRYVVLSKNIIDKGCKLKNDTISTESRLDSLTKSEKL